jgi:molecular chaperone HscB
MDHFERFGLPRRLAVERQALERAYERLSFQHHPDFLTAAPPEERERAQHAAAALNEAYRTLTDDTGRAAYLLELLVDEARSAGRLPPGAKLNTEALPAGFLQEMFGLQEEVDDAPDAAALAALQAPVKARRAATLAERERLFGQAAAGADAALLQTLQSNLNQEKYLLRLLERLRPTPAAAAS